MVGRRAFTLRASTMKKEVIGINGSVVGRQDSSLCSRICWRVEREICRSHLSRSKRPRPETAVKITAASKSVLGMQELLLGRAMME